MRHVNSPFRHQRQCEIGASSARATATCLQPDLAAEAEQQPRLSVTASAAAVKFIGRKQQQLLLSVAVADAEDEIASAERRSRKMSHLRRRSFNLRASDQSILMIFYRANLSSEQFMH